MFMKYGKSSCATFNVVACHVLDTPALTEELASVLSDRTLQLKHSELSLDAFWLLVDKEYPVITQKVLQLLVQF